MMPGFEVYPPRPRGLLRTLAVLIGIAFAGGLILGTVLTFLP